MRSPATTLVPGRRRATLARPTSRSRPVPDPRDPHGRAVVAHIEEYVGKPQIVFRELISDKVHLDVHIVEPTKRRAVYTLVTSGRPR